MQLQVSDEAVASMVAMGFTVKDCRRALRVSGQDIGKAVEFVMEGKRRKDKQREEDNRLLKRRRLGQFNMCNRMLSVNGCSLQVCTIHA